MELKMWMEGAGKSPARPLKKRISDRLEADRFTEPLAATDGVENLIIK